MGEWRLDGSRSLWALSQWSRCLLFVPWEPAGPGLGVLLPLKGGSCLLSVRDGHSRLTETPRNVGSPVVLCSVSLAGSSSTAVAALHIGNSCWQKRSRVSSEGPEWQCSAILLEKARVSAASLSAAHGTVLVALLSHTARGGGPLGPQPGPAAEPFLVLDLFLKMTVLMIA